MLEIILHDPNPQKNNNSNTQYYHIDQTADGNQHIETYNLSKVCPPGFATKIIASPGSLESTRRPDIPAMISSWKDSLSDSGSIDVYFVDAKNILNEYLYDRLSITEVDSHLYNSGSISIHDMFEIRNTLISLGFKVRDSGFLSTDHKIGFVHAEK